MWINLSRNYLAASSLPPQRQIEEAVRINIDLDFLSSTPVDFTLRSRIAGHCFNEGRSSPDDRHAIRFSMQKWIDLIDMDFGYSEFEEFYRQWNVFRNAVMLFFDWHMRTFLYCYYISHDILWNAGAQIYRLFYFILFSGKCRFVSSIRSAVIRRDFTECAVSYVHIAQCKMEIVIHWFLRICYFSYSSWNFRR